MPFNQPLIRCDFFQSHWAPCSELLGTDAYFGSQTELCSIGETGGSIDIDTGGIYFELKTTSRRLIFGDDAFTVT